MNRRAFLKLAAGVSGALGLGLVSKRPERLPVENTIETTCQLTNADLERFYKALVRDGAFNPRWSIEGDWVWLNTGLHIHGDPFYQIFPLRP